MQKGEEDDRAFFHLFFLRHVRKRAIIKIDIRGKNKQQFAYFTPAISTADSRSRGHASRSPFASAIDDYLSRDERFSEFARISPSG